ncbi:MAG: beta-ketoacyl-ACP synthase II [Bacteroidales bacterium]|nr:beta-ketoacyl-ACP synthase II [Bacteroidales bacterium]
MTNNRRVVVTGLGAVSPVGNSVPEFWKAVCSGRSGIDYIRGFEGEELPAKVAGQVKDFDPAGAGLSTSDIRHYDRFSQFAVAATLEAVRQAGLHSGENIAPERLGVYIGSCIGGISTFIAQTKQCLERGARAVSPLFVPMMISNVGGGNAAIHLNAQGPCLAMNTACATGTNSIGEAYLAIRSGRCDAIVAGGSEATVNPLAFGGFANSKALSTVDNPEEASLPFDARRRGFVIGEGAGVMVLEELDHAKARGADIIAEICGYGHTCDAFHYTAPRSDGSTTAIALRALLAEAGYKPGEALYVNAHGTGTILNDKVETLALKLALGEEDAHRASISSTKSMTGHLLGAAGGVEAIVAALAVRHGIVPPTIGLEQPDPLCDLDYTPLHAVSRDLDLAVSNSMGFGGHNACIAFRKYHG